QIERGAGSARWSCGGARTRSRAHLRRATAGSRSSATTDPPAVPGRAAALDLLEDLMSQSDLRHLLVVGAYRNNETNHTHPLVRKIEIIRSVGARVGQITLE